MTQNIELTEEEILALESGKDLSNVDTEYAAPMSRTVHLANNCDWDDKVIIGLSMEWKIIDFMVEVGSLVDTYVELAKECGGILNLSKTLRSVRDLVNAVQACIKIVQGIVQANQKARELAAKFLETFYSQHTFTVESGVYKAVYNTGWKQYFTPSGFASLMGAKTLQMVITDGKKVRYVEFRTNNDHSWITNEDEVVRAKYGTIWQGDPGKGKHEWLKQ
ncbi:hypothetical protein [Amycolatopsis sp. NPDC051071]|uniref:hypothetical protein n=1 Tax=Amycolatopsis sp. NPDC051071 TaxID=3154637 RepID=UPI00343B902B